MNNDSKKIYVDIAGFDGLGLLIPSNSNIIYRHQCGSHFCNQHQLEGELKAIDAPEKLINELNMLDQWNSYFSAEELLNIQKILDNYVLNNSLKLKLDCQESCYGWLVLARGNCFGNHVLIWENDD